MATLVFVSDPWEFGTECGVGPFLGDLYSRSHNEILIGLRSPIKYSGRLFVAILASPRHELPKNSDFPSRESIPANFLLLSSKEPTVASAYYPTDSVQAIGSIIEDGELGGGRPGWKGNF
jgi:hypothetical protein